MRRPSANLIRILPARELSKLCSQTRAPSQVAQTFALQFLVPFHFSSLLRLTRRLHGMQAHRESPSFRVLSRVIFLEHHRGGR